MTNTSGFSARLEKLFWAFLFINPFLDIINGIYINLVMGVDVLDVKFAATLGVTPSLVVRMAMLAVFALYILLLRDRKSILAALPIGLCWALSVVSEYLAFRQVQLFIDMQYAARFCYNIALLMVYTHVFTARWGSDGKELIRTLDDIIAFSMFVLSFSILLSAVIGVGYSTYADRLGYRGNRGFFYAGNDISAVLALLLPLNVASLLQMDRKSAGKLRSAFYAVAGGFGANALMILGSKTAFIAFGLTYAVFLVVAVHSVAHGGFGPTAKGFILSVVSVLVVFTVLMLLSHMELWYSIVASFNVTGELARREGMRTALMSGRQVKLAEHFQQFTHGGVLVWLFGLGRGSQEEILEMDVFEVIFYYGLTGMFAFLFLYAKAAIEFFSRFLRRRDLVCIALVLSLGMCSAYLIIAGHVLFSVTSGFYFALVILYSRVYFADRPEEILLWKA